MAFSMNACGVSSKNTVNDSETSIASKRWKGFDPELGNSVMPHIYSVTCSLSF